jgi:glutathione peroxidase
MKILIKIIISLTLIGNSLMTQSKDSKQSIYDISFKNIDGKNVSLSDFKGKKILIVNVASKCGYTSQYSDLQDLYDKHSDKIEVVAFPCNDFGGQEPGSNAQILEFCSVNYGVQFPVMDKIKIKGELIHPVYKWLTDPSRNGWNSTAPSWNFGKYLIDENGNLSDYYPSNVNPNGEKIISQL